MKTHIFKAVFPVAGLGTRFLPATKAMPKEMLTVVDRPLIQYAVEEAIAAGITELIFVTGRSKRAIEDHFDKAYELENELEQEPEQSGMIGSVMEQFKQDPMNTINFATSLIQNLFNKKQNEVANEEKK